MMTPDDAALLALGILTGSLWGQAALGVLRRPSSRTLRWLAGATAALLAPWISIEAATNGDPPCNGVPAWERAYDAMNNVDHTGGEASDWLQLQGCPSVQDDTGAWVINTDCLPDCIAETEPEPGPPSTAPPAAGTAVTVQTILLQALEALPEAARDRPRVTCDKSTPQPAELLTCSVRGLTDAAAYRVDWNVVRTSPGARGQTGSRRGASGVQLEWEAGASGQYRVTAAVELRAAAGVAFEQTDLQHEFTVDQPQSLSGQAWRSPWTWLGIGSAAVGTAVVCHRTPSADGAPSPRRRRTRRHNPQRDSRSHHREDSQHEEPHRTHPHRRRRRHRRG